MHKSVKDILDKKKNGQKISVITAYDYTLASLCDKAGIDIMLVGDSAGMVMLGYESTIPVTMEQMVLFTEAVSRARQNSLVVADMPFMSYQASISDAIANSGRLIKAGADAVKLEGGKIVAPTIRAIVETGIPVMGHIGFQPQTTTLAQGYRVQAKTTDAALIISESVSIPTIGIGSGKYCDGQVLVVHDLLGMYDKLKPKFVKQYLSLSDQITKAVSSYKSEIESGKFPAKENWFTMEKTELDKLMKEIG
ncbi:MAG: 3-methyl-2-oxobutanoate hydroxymethyltransferase [Thaumarchaeota archaeon]|nr:3-methyl-2-oxobutanoate hydroxymethyltransferase [Nitrososphaerota archaeon]